MSLRVADLRAAYPSFSLGPLTATFDPGVTAVLGPSGSGKSTLLSLIAGFEAPAGGRVSLGARRLDGRPPEERGVGVVFQDDALFPHLSVRENLTFGKAAATDLEGVCELLEICDLLEREPGTLSGGERQRVALARTLLADPDALLLDEPLTSLDAPIRRRLRLDLREILADLDVPVVYVTHDRDEAAVVADRLAILYDGELVQTGDVDAVFEGPATPAVARFLGLENVLPGTLAGVTEAGAQVRVGSATVLTTDGTVSTDDLTNAEEPGTTAVHVAVRPGAIDLQAPGTVDEANVLAVTVRRVVPRYDATTVVLEAEGIGRLTASVDRRTGASLAEGQEQLATIEPADLRTIPAE